MRYDTRPLSSAAHRRGSLTLLLVAIAALALLSTACDDSDDTNPSDVGIMDTSDTGGDTDPGDTDTADPGDTDTSEPDTDPGDVEDTDTDPGDTDTADPDTDDDVEDTDTTDVVACDPACGDNQECVDGTCECTGEWGDCDGDASNGCEEPLNSPEFCGTCDAGANCDQFGITGVCVANTPGQTGFCPLECATGYYDLDGDTQTANPVNGCELGLVEAYATDLSASLPGTVLDAALDGDTLVVAVNDTTLKLVPVDVSGAMPMAGSVVNVGLGSTGRGSLSTSNGIVVVATTSDQFVVYEIDGSSLTMVEDVPLLNVADVAMLPSPVLSESVAEFVAVGDGITWYAVVPKGMELDASCTVGDTDSTVSICEVASNPNPNNAAIAAAGEFAGGMWTVAIGDSVVEAEFNNAPSIDGAVVGGDGIAASASDLTFGPSDTVMSLEGTALASYTYTFGGGGNPQTRSRTELATLAGTGTHLARVSDTLVAAGSDMGLEIVQLSDGASVAVMGIGGADALAADDTRLFVIDGKELVRFDYDFFTP